ncbi:MAG: hypothetical protein IAE78_19870, partial [Myxococcus sp.]|nr:hypothetical protein [Myxococcus sp.]
GFHGAYKSPAHGLLYFRNRWYSVEAGQWLTHDPLGEVDSVNLYAFNRFDSVNFVDPFGLKSVGAASDYYPDADGTYGVGVDLTDPNAPKEPKPLVNTSQVAAGISVGTGATGPKGGPPGPPEPPPSGEWGRFPKNQPKPPGGFNRGVQAAGETEKAVEQLVKKAGPRLGVRAAARTLGAVGVAIIIIDVAEVVGPPVLNAIEGQMTPEPAGTPGPQAASPEKPKPDHPASEPGVQAQEADPEDVWENEGGTPQKPDERPREITRQRPGTRGPPGTDVVQITPGGDAVRIRRYDENGNAIADTDFDHGQPGHGHIYPPGEPGAGHGPGAPHYAPGSPGLPMLPGWIKPVPRK